MKLCDVILELNIQCDVAQDRVNLKFAVKKTCLPHASMENRCLIAMMLIKDD